MQQSMVEAAAQAALAGNAGAVGAATTSVATLTATNVALTPAWTSASVVTGGQPAADQAFTMGIKQAIGPALGSVINAIGAMTDLHVCPLMTAVPTPLVGGVVTKGSSTVNINKMPASRKDDQVTEAGDPNKISVGCPNVKIGG